MILQGKFVFVSSASREYKGKMYYNVNMENIDDESVEVFDSTPEVIAKMQKYQSYNCYIEIRRYSFQGQPRTSFALVDVDSPESASAGAASEGAASPGTEKGKATK